MYAKKTNIKNPSGLHARPASDFIAMASAFKSDITIRHLGSEDDEPVNAKSIVHLLLLGIIQGDQVEISAEGTDEIDAVDKLIALIESGFGEL